MNERVKQTLDAVLERFRSDKMLRAKRENIGMLPKEDYAELMRQGNKKENLSKPQEKTKSKPVTSTNSCAFIKLDHHLLRSEKIRKALRKAMPIYFYLRMNIVRKNFEGDRLGLYDSQYKKRFSGRRRTHHKISKRLVFGLKYHFTLPEGNEEMRHPQNRKNTSKRSLRQSETQCVHSRHPRFPGKRKILCRRIDDQCRVIRGHRKNSGTPT